MRVCLRSCSFFLTGTNECLAAVIYSWQTRHHSEEFKRCTIAGGRHHKLSKPKSNRIIATYFFLLAFFVPFVLATFFPCLLTSPLLALGSMPFFLSRFFFAFSIYS